MHVKLLLLLNISLIFADTQLNGRQSDCNINNCPKDWERFGREKCFRLFGGTKYTWTEAEVICRQHDSHLASVHSKEELDFLNSYFLRENLTDKGMGQTWIGGFKTGVFWSWLDLSTFDFTDWFPGYPIDKAPCIYLTTMRVYLNELSKFGKMANDVTCTNFNFNFICQKYQVDARRNV